MNGGRDVAGGLIENWYRDWIRYVDYERKVPSSYEGEGRGFGCDLTEPFKMF